MCICGPTVGTLHAQSFRLETENVTRVTLNPILLHSR